MSTAPTKVASANRTSMSFRSRDAGSESPRRGARSDRSVGNSHTASVCRRRLPDDPEYIGWRDEGCRLLQRISPRRTASNRDGGAPSGEHRHGPTTNTYYQELIQQQLDRQRADYERQQMKILNYDRQSVVFRCGSKGAPWRQLKLTTGAKGENIMFIDGDVKCKDMAKFYPDDCLEDGGQRSFRGPPRPLPHFYVGTELSLDPNKTARWLKERNENSMTSPEGRRTKRSDQVRAGIGK